MKKHNFNSGPSILPQEVLEQASKAILDFNGIGLSILEIGHRTNWFIDVVYQYVVFANDAKQLAVVYDGKVAYVKILH